jgi:archaellum biogenesis protein FlaJ (TadC family)
LFFLSSLLLVAMAICIFVSTRLMKEPFQLKWYDVALTVAGVLLAYVSLRAQMVRRSIQRKARLVPIYLRLEVGLAACCSIARSIFTVTHFAEIPSRSAPWRSRWRCGRR